MNKMTLTAVVVLDKGNIQYSTIQYNVINTVIHIHSVRVSNTVSGNIAFSISFL